jgi:putative glutamine amidotransferase
MTHPSRNPPRVVLSQRIDSVNGSGETRDALDQNLSRWALSCGLLPYPVPNGLVRPHVPAANGACPLTDWLDALAPAAVILSGGNDIGAAPARDATETILLDWAIVRRLPVLGICRGMQMLAHVAGGQLRQVVGHVRSRHRRGQQLPQLEPLRLPRRLSRHRPGR